MASYHLEFTWHVHRLINSRLGEQVFLAREEVAIHTVHIGDRQH